MRSTSRKKPTSGQRDSRDVETQNQNTASPNTRSNIETSQTSASRNPKTRRTATLYDAVAGRVGVNGFLKPEQLASGQSRASAPEEVLLRRVGAPDEISYDYYNADERLDGEVRELLPDSDLLKDVHGYVADYYELAGDEADGQYKAVDFQSMDETALLAMGILLEEACKEALGENGDMVFSEPARFDRQAPRSRLAQHQVIGRVVPVQVQEYQSSSGEDSVDENVASRPRKRQRRRYRDPDEL